MGFVENKIFHHLCQILDLRVLVVPGIDNSHVSRFEFDLSGNESQLKCIDKFIPTNKRNEHIETRKPHLTASVDYGLSSTVRHALDRDEGRSSFPKVDMKLITIFRHEGTTRQISDLSSSNNVREITKDGLEELSSEFRPQAVTLVQYTRVGPAT